MGKHIARHCPTYLGGNTRSSVPWQPDRQNEKKKKIRELSDTIPCKRRLETDWFPFMRPEEISPGLVSQLGLLE